MPLPRNRLLLLAASVAVVLTAFLLLVPRIGAFGFLDPQETRIADQAKGLLERSGPPVPGYLPPLSSSHLPPVIGGSVDGRPILQTLVVGRCFRAFGLRELAGRTPLLVASLLTLLLVYWLGAGLLSRRAGLVAVVVLASAPLFSMQARQLISDAVPVLLATALFALATRLLVAMVRGERRLAIVLGVGSAVAVVLSALASGLLLGVAVPLAGVAIAGGVLVFSRPATRRPGVLATVAVVAVAALTTFVLAEVKLVTLDGNYYSFAVGGIPSPSHGNISFDYFLKQVGFGFFPWCGLAVPALGVLLVHPRTASDGAPEGDAVLVARLAIATWAVAAFVIGTLFVGRCGDLRYPALAALALAVGDLLDRAVEDPVPRTLTALAAVAVVATVTRDFFLYPQNLAFVHIPNPPSFPEAKDLRDIHLPAPELALGFGIAAAVALGIPLVPRLGKLLPRLGERGVALAWVILVLATGGLFGLFTSQVLTPKISNFFSQREVFEMYHACASGDEPLADYAESGSGARYYAGGMKLENLSSSGELMQFLRRPQRVFVIAPALQLPSINETALEQAVPLHVVLGRGRSLLLSNQLGGKCTQDQNEMNQYLTSTPPAPQHPVAVTWEDKVDLVGWDAPETVHTDSKFPFTLYFHVHGPSPANPLGARLPAGYQIFIHFDSVAGSVRFQGDHKVCDGKLPIENWTPGSYVKDTTEVEVGGSITGGVPSGDYTIYMGFWQGDNRLKVTAGKQDGVNRAVLGTLHVR